jgi:hypothetical protein
MSSSQIESSTGPFERMGNSTIFDKYYNESIPFSGIMATEIVWQTDHAAKGSTQRFIESAMLTPDFLMVASGPTMGVVLDHGTASSFVQSPDASERETVDDSTYRHVEQPSDAMSSRRAKKPRE